MGGRGDKKGGREGGERRRDSGEGGSCMGAHALKFDSGCTRFVFSPSDPTLCVWEVSPHSGEKLSILTSFCLASPPSLLVATHDRLCVARNNHELASYTLDMFNITERGEQLL